jgi:predicted permease
MRAFIHTIIARVRGFLRPGDLEADFDQELAAHLAMAEENKIRQGMTSAEARRAARVELGGLTQLREAGRAVRGLAWVSGFWLDVKLGLRVSRKNWGLTLVGGLAMTVVIFIAAGAFSFFETTMGSRVPLSEGDRIVALMTWDTTANRRRSPSHLDFERWRDVLRSVEDIAAFQTVERSLAVADGPAEPVPIAEMTASGFQLARVPALLGRPLVESDERDAADPVVVIGYDEWRSKFSSDPAVVGTRVRLDNTLHTVVGVMPEDFAFPINHRVWTPLRSVPSVLARNEGPAVFAFGRLAPGVTLAGAQAELTTIGLLASAVPERTERLETRVVPYTEGLVADGSEDLGMLMALTLFLVTLLLVPPCANIAILVYARTVARQEEFAARYALGASRGRIVVQLFVEVLVLAAGAAGVALVLVRAAGGYVEGIVRFDRRPFWMDFSDISFTTVLFAAGLAMLAAMIAGVLPALQATGQLMQSGLRSLGSRSGMRLGMTWSALIVAQVAFALAVLPVAVEWAWGTLRPGILGPGFAAEEFLTARLMMDQGTTSSTEAGEDQRPFASRFGDRQAELVRQLEAEPGVSAVAVSAAVPGREPWAGIEVDGVTHAVGAASDRQSYVMTEFNHVDDVFFDAFDVPLLIGRSFDAGDFAGEQTAVIVNRTFAQHIVGDGSPLGVRVRYVRTSDGPASESGPWYEIVGVVADLPANTSRRKMYHPLAPGLTHPVSLALRAEPMSARVAGRLRELSTRLDPTLHVDELLPLDEVYREYQRGNNIPAYLLAAVTLSILFLSAAGMYALMSFTVNQRRREIGIRSALGAQPRRLLAGVFKRALGQVATGASIGILAALLLSYYLPIEEMGGWNVPGVLPAAAVLMVVVGLLSAMGPARRGLRVEPTEALREG